MRYLMLAMATVIAAGMVACGKRNDSVANPNQYRYGYGGYGYQYGLAANRVGGPLEAIGADALAQILGQYGGMCANNGWNNYPGQLNWSATFGSWNCRQYTQAGGIRIVFDRSGTLAHITLIAGSNNYGGQQLRFEGRVYPINNSTGMLIRASGVGMTGSWSAQYDQGLEITVQQGTAASVTMQGTITYRGRHLADVHLYRF